MWTGKKEGEKAIPVDGAGNKGKIIEASNWDKMILYPGSIFGNEKTSTWDISIVQILKSRNDLNMILLEQYMNDLLHG